ncbi:hypothetical protein OKW39_008619 [Paraburkholderia sp. MM6662-R1]
MKRHGRICLTTRLKTTAFEDSSTGLVLKKLAGQSGIFAHRGIYGGETNGMV